MVKDKVSPRTGHEGPKEGVMYTSTLSLTSALEGAGCKRHPRPLYPGKDPVPIVYEVGWAPGRVCTGSENMTPTGIRSPDHLAPSESQYQLHYPGPP
jgi:hypothetical protein